MKIKNTLFYLIFILLINIVSAKAQTDSLWMYELETENNPFSIGGYSELEYQQNLIPNGNTFGTVDLHRFVISLGYKFSNRLQMVSEVEIEHISEEIGIEQAYIKYRINDYLNIKSGRILVPMGRMNEHHEPTLFNGMERPITDKYIIPTTWSELGLGITGNSKEISVKYQAYLINGLLSYDGAGKFDGNSGLRNGRQEDAYVLSRLPAFCAKLDYYGVPGLKLGMAYYTGSSQTELYRNKIINDTLQSIIDSSVIGINMVGFNLYYEYHRWSFISEYVISSQSNTSMYNEFTHMDVGKSSYGYYLELAWTYKGKKSRKCVPFVRYENINTHHKVESIQKNASYNRIIYTVGCSYHISTGAAIKVDWQKNLAGGLTDKQVINIGIALNY